MAEHTDNMNLADMLELMKGGAKIEIARPAQIIAQFDELVSHIKQLIAGNEARAVADKMQAQSQLEVLATLQALIKKQPSGVNRSSPLDLEPLQTVLAEMAQANTMREEPHDYEFTFDRGPQGFTTKIYAKVVRPTLN